jgi:uncharacterized protein YfaS (alpha-2-macroglobulin family)
MSRNSFLQLALVVVLVAAASAAWGLFLYYNDLPSRLSQHETVVLGQDRLVPGSKAALRVLVRDSKDGAPLSDAEVQIELKPSAGGEAVTLYAGKTGINGTADITFEVPDDTNIGESGLLVVKTRSELGADAVERQVKLEREYRVLLTTDKPLYQPGQVIHVRALALATFDLRPAAGQPLEITIADGKGNKVFRQRVTTSPFGVAFTDFQLANEVNSGAYKITASLGNTSSEKTVTVEHYVLPKFALNLQTDRTFYQPGQRVQGSLQASYFFGKPVGEGKVLIEGFTFDVERTSVFTLEGQTDPEGRYEFEFDIPAYLAGSEFEGGMARFYLQAAVVDQAQHSEVKSLSLPVASSVLIVEAVPEGGAFRPGLENILYVVTSYPDGTPAQTELRIDFPYTGQQISQQSGRYGLAEVRYTPDQPYQYFTIEAVDPAGNRAYKEFNFEASWTAENIILRPEQPVYRVGETMNLTILTTAPRGTVYLDIVREGQTVSTRALDIYSGKALAAVDLTPDLFGTLELHAYRVPNNGSIIRDTRIVAVSQADGLGIALNAQKETYLPGENAALNIQVSGPDGKGVQAAVGLAIVDEAVFALAESDPGFARLYFLLEKEIMQPRYDLHGYSLPDIMRGLPAETETGLKDAVNLAAQASLSEVSRGVNSMGGNVFAINASSRVEAMQRAEKQRSDFFQNFSKGVFVVFLLLPLALVILSAAALRREKSLIKGILLGLGLLALAGGFFALVPAPDGFDWGSAGFDRMSAWIRWLSYQGEGVVLLLLALAPLSLLVLIGVAVRRKDALLGWTLGLLPLVIMTIGLLLVSMQNWSFFNSQNTEYLAMGAFLLTPFALLMRLSNLLLKRQYLLAVLVIPLILFMLGGFLPLVDSIASASRLQPGLRNMMVLEEAVPAMVAMPMAGAAGVEQEKTLSEDSAAVQQSETGQGSDSPRLRQYFPETMLWLPDAVTGPDGSLVLEFPVADSITTWRMTALASSQNGLLGSASAPLRVFQDFFIDLDLPLSLTVGDEVAVPVGVFNYLPDSQTVRLELEQSDWFDLIGEPVQEMEIAANDIDVVYFRIRARQFGMKPFQVTAYGSRMSDAILKEVRVYPDGKEIRFTQSDQLTTDGVIQQSVLIPQEAIGGTQKLMVKIYPGVISQVVEGLESMLRMPHGCFEQTSSTTYPNVLVLDYLKTTNQAAPEVQLKAEQFINLGYQRLTTFEVGVSGGFSLFGNPPADRMLTAYGLQEFSDMSRVHEVDPNMIDRAARWLLSQQSADGSWENDRGLVHEDTWSSLGNDKLPVTAYITWSLVEAGYASDPGTVRGLQYVREFQSQAQDPYVVALVANTLVAADLKSASGEMTPTTLMVLDRLASLAQRDGEGVYWQSGVATFMGSEGKTGSIETTSLAALAILSSERHPDLGNGALVYLVRQKDSFGTWYSTQATVLALKALLQSVRGSGELTSAAVTITLNGEQTVTLQVTPENFDVVQMVTFDGVAIGRENVIEIKAEGKGSLMYQLTGSYYLPWDMLALYPELTGESEALEIGLSYDRTELAVNDSVEVQVNVALTEPGAKAESALIDLGIPPGFSVQTEDLAALVARFKDTPPDYAFAKIERFELTGRQVLIYVTNLSEGKPLSFSYRLRARFPLDVQSPGSNAYDYYNPDVTGDSPPQRLVVVP